MVIGMRRSRFLTALAAAAVLVTGSLAVPATPAAAAAKTHIVLWNTPLMKIKDEETGQDTNRTWTLWTHEIRPAPNEKLHWENCAGGEARGEFDLTVEPVSGKPGHAAITMQTRLYEGASCTTSDYENSETTVFTMLPNTTSSHDIHVRSLERCGGIFSGRRCNDYVKVKFTLTNEYK